MDTPEPTDSKKSFYNKCNIVKHGNIIKLQSYSTIVAQYNKQSGVMAVHGWYSCTTARHINSFLDYFGFPTVSKAEMEDWKPHTSACPNHKGDHIKEFIKELVDCPSCKAILDGK